MAKNDLTAQRFQSAGQKTIKQQFMYTYHAAAKTVINTLYENQWKHVNWFRRQPKANSTTKGVILACSSCENNLMHTLYLYL